MLRLETERLIIDELNESDASFTLAMLNDEDFIEHVVDRGIRTLDQARQYLREGAIRSYRENGFGMFAVRLKHGGDTIGMCGLVDREGLQDIDIGYGFLPTARGQGYAHEAAACVLDWGSKQRGLDRIVAIVGPTNRPSINLLERLGMQFESMVRLPDGDEEICLYAMESKTHDAD